MLELRNPIALKATPVRELFARAFADERFSGPKEVAWWVAENVHRPEIQVLIARSEEGELVGLSITSRDKGVFSEHPWNLHFYSEGGRATTNALTERTVAWLREQGETCVRVINQTGRTDDEHMQIFGPHVNESVKIGSVIEYRVAAKE